MSIPDKTPFSLLGFLCPLHGGAYTGPDRPWICVGCARRDIQKCACGGHASIFGEALMVSISCEECEEHLTMIGTSKTDIVLRWNHGERGNR